MPKSKHYPDFSLNPHNVTIGDWVFARGNVGKVIDIHVNNGKMLQFWVNWGASNVPSPELANNLQKVNKPMAISDSIREVSEKIKLTLLTIDTNLQQRVEINDSVVDDYAHAYSEGVELPPITVWREEGNREQGVGSSEQVGSGEKGIGSSDNNQVIDSHNSELTTTADSLVTEPSQSMVTESSRSTLPTPRYYLVDGFHRVEAAKIAGINELPFIEKSGTYREALLFSLGVNSTHGLRRSNADKRKAVMTLLQDSEWSQWSDRVIAKQCKVSHTFVAKLRNQVSDNSLSTVNVASCNSLCNQDDSTVNVASSSNDNNKNNARSYIKDGVKGEMMVGNIGKGKSNQSPQSFNEEAINEFALPESGELKPDSFTDNEDKSENPTKPTKGKQKITNPLSVGDRVKVKDNHYFGGREGVVTQIPSPHSLVVAFDNDQREFLRLEDLDLPTILSQPQKPQKKEILIKEGLNYKAGEGCKWYIEVEEKTYHQLQNLRAETGAITIDGALTRFLAQSKKQETYNSPKFNSPVKSLNVSIITLNIIQRYVNNHGEEALIALL